MARVLITGMSGAGKSTVLSELNRRGHRTVDTDYGGWVLPDGTWDEARMSKLLLSTSEIIVGGAVDNQTRFYDRFDEVILLSAPVNVLIERVSSGRGNPYGRSEADRERIRHHVLTVEPLLRARATRELDGLRSITDLVDEIEGLMMDPTKTSARDAPGRITFE